MARPINFNCVYNKDPNEIIKLIQNTVFESQKIELKMKLGLIHQDYETLLSAAFEKILSIIVTNSDERSDSDDNKRQDILN